jgi:hypothetical protein
VADGDQDDIDEIPETVGADKESVMSFINAELMIPEKKKVLNDD